jgi:dTDP-4-dehydrorhamnose 3,5-epimerase
MKIIQTDLPGCVVIEPLVHGDARGFFYESFNAQKYKNAGLDLRFVQSNVSRSAHGVLRGLHYQYPNPQGKLVNVLEGEVYDVAVDINVRRCTITRPMRASAGTMAPLRWIGR